MGHEEEDRPFYIKGLRGEKVATPDNTFVRGEGMIVVLEDGTRLEAWEGLEFVNNIGLGRADMAKALAEQAVRLSYMAPSRFADIRLALTKDLQSVLPHGISVPFYSIGGADSIEAAIRAARKVTHRKNVLTFTGGFHGDTMTTESVSGWGVLEYGDPRPWTVHVPSPYDWFQDFGDWDRAYERCLEAIGKALKRRGPRSFACILVEPVTGVCGAVPLSRGLSRGLRELCDRHAIKLIADEVVTGFGRTGEWFGSTSVGLEPDAMVLAKGLTGGYAPLGAAVFERSWGEELRDRGFPHGPTFGGHPLGCAAARETIRILRDERLVERAKTVGAYVKKRLVELGQQHPAVVRDVRGLGLLLALELRAGHPTTRVTRTERLIQRAKTVGAYTKARLQRFGREPRTVVQDVRGVGLLLARELRVQGGIKHTHPASRRVVTILRGLRSDGLRVWTNGDGSSLMLCPPFIVTEGQVDRFVDRLDFHVREIPREHTVPSGMYVPGGD